MEPDRWRRIDGIFQAALDCEAERRAAFVAAACEGDAALQAEIESLLAAYRQSGFTEAPAFEDGVRVLERADALAGQSVGHYRLLREIGRGGMGSVYLAARADEAFQKYVAIKIIRRGLDTDDIIRRFQSERQILATLDHPNITRLLDGGTTDDGLPYFVMELIDGEPIDRYCDRRALTVTERLNLFQSVCAAVGFAHQNLVVHRDIKPGNVLVTGDGVPRLLDFGIAKLLVPGTGPIDGTMTGPRLLTPQYASPEQVRGESITTASDVYSLGALLYVLLTGAHPYRQGIASHAEIERAICEEEPQRPSLVVMNGAPDAILTREGTAEKLRRRLQGDLDAIVLKALRKEPQRRYGSVEQLADDLRRHLQRLPVLAHADHWSYRAGKFVRRHRSGVLASALIVLALIVGVVGTTWQAGIARAERARAERQFNDIRRISTSFLFELHTAIQNLPGSTPARKLLVQRALEYLGKLAEEAHGDRRLQLDVAEAYLKVGDVQGNPYAPNLGDTHGAADSYRKALATSRALADSDPHDEETRRYVARSLRSLADVLPQLGRPTEAIGHFRDAISILESLSAARQTDSVLREELAACYQELGDLQGHNGLQNLGNPAAAIESYRKSLALYEALVAAVPASRAARRGVALLDIRIGDMEEIRDDLNGGARAYRAALKIAQQLSAEDPTNAEDRRRLALAHRKVGGIEEDLHNYDEALTQYAEAASINETMMNADPTNVQASMSYVISLRWAGDLLQLTGDASAALLKYRRVLEILNRLALTQAANVTVQQRLAEMLIVTSRVLAQRGDLDESRRMTERGLAMSRELANRPEVTPDDLSQYALGFLTCEPAVLREPATALRYAKASVDRSGGTDSGNLDILAQAYFANHELAHAIEAEERALALLAPLGPDQPDPPMRRRIEAQLAKFKAAIAAPVVSPPGDVEAAPRSGKAEAHVRQRKRISFVDNGPTPMSSSLPDR